VADKQAAADRSVAEVQRRAEQRLHAEAERWREFATGPDASAEWRWVANRVESGDLRWHDLAAGNAWDDEAVTAAMAASPSARRAPALPEDLDDELADSPLRSD
jgi:hypothetical protein